MDIAVRASRADTSVARMQPMTIARTGGTRGSQRPRGRLSRYAREIVVILVLKTLALAAIWQLWFSPPHRQRVDAQRIAERLYAPAGPAADTEERHARP